MNSNFDLDFDNEPKRSWAEIDLARLCENYRIYKSLVPKDMDVMAVVKADAYGHGDLECSLSLAKAGVELFAVATLNEAIKLREGGVRGEILILGYTPAVLWEKLFEYDLTQTILSEEYAESLAAASRKKIKCQVALDTGMNRIGLNAKKSDECERVIRKYAEIFDINGIYTHLCVAECEGEEELSFTEIQRKLFLEVASRLSDLKLKYLHFMNSAGGLYHTANGEYNGNVARLGIMLYGLKPDADNILPDGIKPVMNWKTVVAMVKTVSEGETVGYGRTFKVQKPMKIATLPIGYADGYSRMLSNKGHVLIKGKRARIVGRVCMDQTMVDVTDIDSVAMGDEAVLIGEDGAEKITADDMAELIGTIGYEVICNVSSRVVRVYK